MVDELIDTADVNQPATHDAKMTPLCSACVGNHLPIVEKLLKHPYIQLDLANQHGWRPAHFAAKQGNIDILLALLIQGADVNAVSNTNDTPLLMACEYGKEGAVEKHSDYSGCIRLMLSRGADINAVDHEGWTPLITLCRYSDDVDTAKTLIDHWANVNAASDNGFTPLIQAAGNGCLQLISTLLDNGAVINSQEDSGCTALYHTAKLGHRACLETLIRAGADVNICSSLGRTPLLSAASHGQLSTLEVLIAAGCDVNHRTHSGMSVLIAAAQDGHADCMEALFQAGAENITFNDDNALMAACDGEHIRCIEMLLKRDDVDVNAKDEECCSALYTIAENGDLDCLRLLLSGGADPKQRAIGGCTPLQVACSHGQLECAKILLPISDIDAADDEGRTALYWACKADKEECAGLLARKGANQTIRTSDGGTAMSIAKENGNSNIVRILRKNRNRMESKPAVSLVNTRYLLDRRKRLKMYKQPRRTIKGKVVLKRVTH